MYRPIHVDDLSFIAHQFQSTRMRINLRVVEVVHEAGYKNANKGCRRLRAIEKGKELVHDSVYERFAHVLDIDLDELEEQVRKRRIERRKAAIQELPKRVLGTLLRDKRKEAGLTIEETVNQAGLEPSPHYEERLRCLEAGRDRFPTYDEMVGFAAALSLRELQVYAAYQAECRVYDKRKQRPTLVLRAMPAIYVTEPLPKDANTERALEYATEFAAKVGLRASLVFPDQRSVYIEPNGRRSETFQPPTMKIR